MDQMDDCEKCFKHYNPVISGECLLCRDYVFHENILCDLLRSAQDSNNKVECFAYKPNLSVIGENREIYEVIQNSDKEIELSDRLKWLKAYALQQWKYDPDQIFCNLNFHVCLITKKREKLFEIVQNRLVEISAIFNNAGDRFDGKVSFLCAGSDHIHLHVDSPPDYSADEVVNRIMVFVESAIINDFSELLGDRNEIFERLYFIETIG